MEIVHLQSDMYIGRLYVPNEDEEYERAQYQGRRRTASVDSQLRDSGNCTAYFFFFFFGILKKLILLGIHVIIVLNYCIVN